MVAVNLVSTFGLCSKPFSCLIDILPSVFSGEWVHGLCCVTERATVARR